MIFRGRFRDPLAPLQSSGVRNGAKLMANLTPEALQVTALRHYFPSSPCKLSAQCTVQLTVSYAVELTVPYAVQPLAHGRGHP